MKAFSSGFLLLAFHFLAAGSLSQSPQREEMTVWLASDLVLVPVSVISKKTGLPIGGLKREDLLLLEDGRPQHIVLFGHEDVPLSVLLLVEAWRVEDVARAAPVILNRLKPEDEVAVMIFWERPYLIQELTADKNLVIQKLERLAEEAGEEGTYFVEGPWGGFRVCSMLWNSIYEGAHYLVRVSEPGRRRAMIVFTYGLGEGPPVSEEEKEELKKKVLGQVYQSDIVINGILVGFPAHRFVWGVLGRPFFKPLGMEELVRITGGQIGSIKPGQFLKADKLIQLIDHLRAQYVLGYMPTNATRDGRIRKIKVELSSSAKKRYRDAQLRHRQGYVPQPAGEGAGERK